MTTNLIHDAWIPIRTPDGTQRISPIDLSTCRGLAPATPRADFDAATYEFLIGLLQTFCTPEREMNWESWAEKPPSREELASRLSPHADAFRLDHESQPFLQEIGLHESPASRLSDLLIDGPGTATVDDNKDLFIKRAETHAYCGPCTTLALITLQSFSPAGGRGNMTSIRGGGPLSSIVTRDTLWDTVWANVLPAESFGKPIQTASASVLPWLHPPSPPKEKRAKVFATDVHGAHVFWGMPRRILLGPVIEIDACSLCGEPSQAAYDSYHGRPYGFDYQGSWTHPLSPSQDNKGEISSRKGRSDLGGYRQWVGLVGSSSDGLHTPAKVIHHFRASPTRALLGKARVRASGYKMDNAKVEGWYEGTMRELLPGDDSTRERTDGHAGLLVTAAKDTAGFVRSAYKEALYDRPKDVKGDFGFVTNPLWTRTEAAFYESLGEVARSPDAVMVQRVEWWKLLNREARALFQSNVQYARFADADVQRVIRAESKLHALLERTLPKKLELTRDDLQTEAPNVEPPT